MFPFKWTPLVLNIFDKNVKSQLEGRKGNTAKHSLAQAWAPRPPMPAGASRALRRAGCQRSPASPLFNDNGFTASLHIGVILCKQG